MRPAIRRAGIILAAFCVASVLPVNAIATRPVEAGHAAASNGSAPLDVTITQMVPWTPTPTSSPQPLTISAQLRNTTDHAISNVTLQLGRAAVPVESQSELTSSAASDGLPSDLQSIPARPAVKTTIDVPPDETVDASFRTTTTTSTPCALCLYANAVYPLYLSAVDSRTGTVDGFTRTYLSSVDQAKDVDGNPYQKVGVAWIWPLIDRPHRLLDARLFTDNGLATEIGNGGRLDRALQVVEDVESDGPAVPITLLIDPELVDELAVMATGHYSYRTPKGRLVRGTAGPVAKQWLSRLHTLLTDPAISPEFTPYADPDVQALADRGLDWHTGLPATMLTRVEGALGLPNLSSDLSSPPGGVASGRTLNRIAQHGSTSVLLDTSAVTPSSVDGLPSSLVTLRTSHGQMTGALLSPAAQSQIAATIDYTDHSLSRLPALLAQVAVRGDVPDYKHRVAFLSPPRYVDADPTTAETVIRETTSSAFSTPESFATASSTVGTSGATHGRVRALPDATPDLSVPIVEGAQSMQSDLPALRSLFTSGTSPSPAALVLLASLPRALQRTESAGWLPGSTVGEQAGDLALAGRLRRQRTRLLTGVHIVRPKDGHYSYTLASTNSPLPITVENTLPYRAFVHIDVDPVAGLPGLTTTDLGVQSIEPETKQTFRVPAHVQRSGRIQLIATLDTASGRILGSRVRLSVHSTVFGTIGIVITVVAAIVLLLALALRYVRRLLRLRRKRHAVQTGEPVTTPEPVS